MRQLRIISLGIAWAFSAVAFAQTPVPDQAKKDTKIAAEEKSDIETGKKYAAEVEKELKVSKNVDFQARVDRIGGELAKVANDNVFEVSWGDKRHHEYPYVFKVLEGDDVNAFSLPGGYIFVYEGLMKFAETDDELAGVLGHEISHAAFRHLAVMAKQQSKMSIAQIPLVLAVILSGGRVGGDLLQLSSLVGTAMTSGWSVDAEKAADYGGFQILRKSHYNPVAMLTFMERLQKQDRAMDTPTLGILRTHPPGRERAASMVANLNKAHIPIRRSEVSESFRVRIVSKDPGMAEAWFGSTKLYTFSGSDSGVRAAEAAVKLNDFFDTVPSLFEVRLLDNKQLVGNKSVLFVVQPSDAAAAKISVADLAANTLSAIKRSLYTIQYRVWDSR